MREEKYVRLSGWRNMLDSVDGEEGGVYVENVSLLVSCYSAPYEGNCIGGGGIPKKRTCQDNVTPRNSPLISPLLPQTGTDFAYT